MSAPQVTESAVLKDFDCNDVWNCIRSFDFARLFPSAFAACDVVASPLAALSAAVSVRRVTLADGTGSVALIKATRVSDGAAAGAGSGGGPTKGVPTSVVSWETSADGDALPYATRSDTVTLRRVSASSSTYAEWAVQLNADADAAAVAAVRDSVQACLAGLRTSIRGLPARPYKLPDLSADEVALYFGDFAVRFSRVPGALEAYAPGCLREAPNTTAERKTSHARMQPLAHHGEEYAHVYVAAIPAPDPVAAFDPATASDVPEVLRAPLLKTEDGDVVGIRSGGRSAIMMVDGVAYRLKGCGNYVDGEYNGKSLRFPYPGFPIAPTEKMDLMTLEMDADAVEIRGCCFEHTAHRELLMAGTVGEAMASINVPCGLDPVGTWRYDVPEAPLPAVGKYCGLFRTLGERRLASHLIAGLELLVPILARDGTVTDALAAVKGKFDAADRLKDTVQKVHDENGAVVREVVHPVVPTHEACFALGDARRLPVDFVGTAIGAGGGEGTSVAGAYPSELGGTATAEGEAGFHRIWDEAAASLAAALEAHSGADAASADVGDALFHLAWRIGRETGAIMRAMKDAKLSWGYYLDHVIEFHNNAHPNNMVVLPPSAGDDGAGVVHGGALLAPVDFDMAYPRDSYYLNATGEPDPEDFDANLKSEAREMGLALAGGAASTGLVGLDTTAHMSAEHKILRWALRDTMLAGFQCAYAKRVDPHPTTQALDAACHALVRMSLVAASGRHS